MGNADSALRQVKGKSKTGKKIVQKKIKTAKATGILSLQSNALKKVPIEIWTLTNLKTLDLACNKITMLEDSVNALSMLKILILRDNRMEKLPQLSGCLNLVTVRKKFQKW